MKRPIPLFILILLIGFPVFEGAVLYLVGQGHAWWLTAWLVFAIIAGMGLIKQARFTLGVRLAHAFSQGRFSLTAFIDSFRMVFAGLLLILPGLTSDILALLLLLLPMRDCRLESAFNRAEYCPSHPSRRANNQNTIDGQYRRELIS